MDMNDFQNNQENNELQTCRYVTLNLQIYIYKTKSIILCFVKNLDRPAHSLNKNICNNYNYNY